MFYKEIIPGKNCIGQIRCSTDEQARRSLPQQQTWLREFASEHKLPYVGDMQEAISASQIKRRPDIERILERKKVVNDFEYVIVQDLSRLTRGGTEHGLDIYFQFKRVGIQLISIVDGLISGEEKVIEAARRFQEARAAAKSTALASIRGTIDAKTKKRVAYSSCVPFGIDRLILNARGEPKFILRNYTDGTQQKLSAAGDQVIETFGKNQNGEKFHYVRQWDELVELIIGSKESVAIVNRIFSEYFVRGFSPWMIAKGLNNDGIPSPRGKKWNDAQINNILENAIYVGKGISNRISKGIFYNRGEHAPVASQTNDEPLGMYRPESEWKVEMYPKLTEFLSFDPEMRETIANWQMMRLRRLARRESKKRGGDKHLTSSFILKNILHSKIGNLRMTGAATYKDGKPYKRYYRVSRAFCFPESNNVLRRQVPANLIEAAVLETLKRVLSEYPGAKLIIQQTCEEQVNRPAGYVAEQCASLKTSRDALLAQMEYWIRQVSIIGTKMVDEKTEPIKTQITEIGGRLEELEREANTVKFRPTDLTNLEAVFAALQKNWLSLDFTTIRSILSVIIEKLEIDLETFEVDVLYRLPTWIIKNPKLLGTEVCLDQNRGTPSSLGADSKTAFRIAKFKFVPVRTHCLKAFECIRLDVAHADAA